MRRIDKPPFLIAMSDQDAIDAGIDMDYSYPAVQPGDVVRNALEYGVTADLKIGESCFDDDEDFTSIDPLSDVRTDWDDLSERQYIQDITGMPSAGQSASAEANVEAPVELAPQPQAAEPVPQPQAAGEGVA